MVHLTLLFVTALAISRLIDMLREVTFVQDAGSEVIFHILKAFLA